MYEIGVLKNWVEKEKPLKKEWLKFSKFHKVYNLQIQEA